MKIGITGHQSRDGADWIWVKGAIRIELTRSEAAEALSSLAIGSDQIFAETALELGIPVLAIIPFPGYESCFRESDLANYRRLLARCRRLELPFGGDKESAFFSAGKYIVDKSDIVVAVWDGGPSEGLGGTADVVDYARHRGCRLIQLDPIERRASVL